MIREREMARLALFQLGGGFVLVPDQEGAQERAFPVSDRAQRHRQPRPVPGRENPDQVHRGHRRRNTTGSGAGSLI